MWKRVIVSVAFLLAACASDDALPEKPHVRTITKIVYRDRVVPAPGPEAKGEPAKHPMVAPIDRQCLTDDRIIELMIKVSRETYRRNKTDMEGDCACPEQTNSIGAKCYNNAHKKGGVFCSRKDLNNEAESHWSKMFEEISLAAGCKPNVGTR